MTDSSASKSISRSASREAPGGRPSVARAPSIVGGGRHPDLAAAVVAAARCLEPERQPDRVRRRGRPQLVGRADLAPGRHGDPGALDEPALGDAVVGHDQRPVPGPDRDERLDGRHDGRRDVLQLVGDDGAAAGQAERGADVVVRADHQLVGDRCAGAIDVRVEDRDAVAHRAGGLREHPAELAATEDADRGGRQDRRADGGRHAPECTGRDDGAAGPSRPGRAGYDARDARPAPGSIGACPTPTGPR